MSHDRDRSTSLSLLERVRGHDGDAWGRLLDLYSPLVAYWCKHSGVQHQEIDDLVQDVFHAVYKSLETFRRDRTGDTFRGWLRGITRFKVQDYFRRKAAEPAAQGGPNPTGNSSRSPSPTSPRTRRKTSGRSTAAPWRWSVGSTKPAPGKPSGGLP